ncbi:MAG: rhodanese-like domain-containing protein [Fimbriimonadales bacterium]|nr:rhodanese-like domain-containing protein [Fimbriimonadales bacterium]
MRIRETLIAALLGVSVAGCEVQQAQSEKATVTPREVYEQRESKEVLIIDVRTPEEFKAERIEQAQNKPLDKIDQWVKELPKDKKIYFVCRSGNRSERAQRIAQQAGYKNAYNMEGGMLAWRREGLPVVSDGGANPKL